MLRKKLRLSPSEEFSSYSDVTTETDSATATGISKYFNNFGPMGVECVDIPTKLLEYATALNIKLKNLVFSDRVKYIYNPVEYAYDMHATFLRKYCNTEKKILLLGVNPGPWGMSQTGIPFGEVNIVRDWYKIDGKINKPEIECPERQIMGMDCHRSEVSGKRLCEFFQKICIMPETFFQHTYLYNFCPLALMANGGKNITPTSLKGSVKGQLEDYCSETLIQVLKLLKIEIIVAIGRYPEVRAQAILKNHNIDNIQIIYMTHPSPIIPRPTGSATWEEQTEKMLNDNNLLQYFIPHQ